ncbi:hypothetical protein [Geomonas propionica]|uniref:Transposase n=1 Tax=Geomonas propionica TaxID=2798582 RepID=A0ABS0YR68_9BACT|nr:hypothetical protein [Geomonas propionica]MBJ6800433.1 hypothetical protein [Geomonas propionica]
MRKGCNGKMVGEENVAKLKLWLDQVDAIPMHGGKPNKSEIARLAGLADRQPLDNNPECQRLLALAVASKGGELQSRYDEERARQERRIRELETRADKEMAENFELKRMLKKLQHVEQILEAGGRVIPWQR